jgi:hypothetical protein
VQFLSLGTSGTGGPVRATISGFGPLLLAKVLGLSETQESTLGLIFHWRPRRHPPGRRSGRTREEADEPGFVEKVRSGAR